MSRRLELTPEQVAEVLTLRGSFRRRRPKGDQGLTWAEIAERLGTTVNKVRYAADQVRQRQRKRKKTAQNPDEARRYSKKYHLRRNQLAQDRGFKNHWAWRKAREADRDFRASKESRPVMQVPWAVPAEG